MIKDKTLERIELNQEYLFLMIKELNKNKWIRDSMIDHLLKQRTEEIEKLL